MTLFFRKYYLYDETKTTELEHTTTVQETLPACGHGLLKSH